MGIMDRMSEQAVQQPVKGFFDQQVRRTIRSLAGWYDVSLEQIANAAGMRRSTLYERMKDSPFRNEEVANIALAFGLTHSQFTEGLPSGASLPVAPPVLTTPPRVSPSNPCLSDYTPKQRAAA